MGTCDGETWIALEEMPELCDTCQGELLTGSGTSPRERSVTVNQDERSWRSEEDPGPVWSAVLGDRGIES